MVSTLVRGLCVSLEKLSPLSGLLCNTCISAPDPLPRYSRVTYRISQMEFDLA
jgi:hypothetical protein